MSNQQIVHLKYGQSLDALMVENSELAHFDTLAIITAIEENTAVLRLLLERLTQTTPTNIPQPNIQTTNDLVNSVNLQILQPVARPSAKLQKAIDWLMANPSRSREPSRDLALIIGVSHTTVAKAQSLVNL